MLQALLHVLALSLYFYNIRKGGKRGNFLTFSNDGEVGGSKTGIFSNVIKVQPLPQVDMYDLNFKTFS